MIRRISQMISVPENKISITKHESLRAMMHLVTCQRNIHSGQIN